MKLIISAIVTFYMISGAFAQQATLEEKERQIRALNKQISMLSSQKIVLNNEFTKLKKKQAEAEEEVRELTARLQALGLYEGGREDQLLQAVADARLLNDQLESLKEASLFAIDAFKEFVRVASVANPEQGKNVAKAIQKLEAELWGDDQAEKKGPNKLGTLQDASVISIDAQSGMLVLNVGKKVECKTGMTFQIRRGNRELGEGMITEVRTHVAGLFIVSRVKKDIVFRVGDTAHLKLRAQ